MSVSTTMHGGTETACNGYLLKKKWFLHVTYPPGIARRVCCATTGVSATSHRKENGTMSSFQHRGKSMKATSGVNFCREYVCSIYKLGLCVSKKLPNPPASHSEPYCLAFGWTVVYRKPVALSGSS